MTRVQLIEDLKKFCQEATAKMKLPLAVQKGDTQKQVRAPEIYKMRLPDSQDPKKYAPYIIVQLVGSQQIQKEGKPPFFTAAVRFIFAVYCDDEQEGAIMLLNVMDRVQQKLLAKVQVGKSFLLDVHEPLEAIIYPDSPVPYYAGEMAGTFILPPTEREVDFFGK